MSTRSRAATAGSDGLRVVHVYDGHEKVHDGRGSVPNVVWNVARETAASGHEVTVLERRWEGLTAAAQYDGVAFERLGLRTGADEPYERVPHDVVTSARGLARLVVDRTNFAVAALRRLRGMEFDVVHVHLPFAANVLATAAPWLRERMVYTAHLGELRLNALSEAGDARADGGLEVPDVLSVASPDVYLARRVAHTTVLNPGVRRVFENRGVSPERLSVVPNGVDLDRFRDVDPERTAAVAEQYDLGSGPVALFVGALVPRKGVDDLLRATSDLVSERGFDDLTVVVAGEEGVDEAFTRRLRSLVREHDLSENVTFTGFVPAEDLPSLYDLADVYVLPSIEEGFGMTVTEAMAAGTPVVATRVGGVPRLVDDGDHGTLVDPGSPDELAAGLATLLADPDRRARMGEEARERAERFSWDRIGDDFVSVYREVAR